MSWEKIETAPLGVVIFCKDASGHRYEAAGAKILDEVDWRKGDATKENHMIATRVHPSWWWKG